ncbi:hypothetical protein [Aneurinibacillus terranovensis]|uniref:hypothetical protein n=1 Tax=Aneurinibacillus terranovensis TaxID=278991 RepID=UPI0009D71658
MYLRFASSVEHEVADITLEVFQYPLQNAALRMGHSLAISNKLAEPMGKINMKSGYLIVIKSAD